MNQKLNYKIIGSGPPLVLLHGWGWHSGIWKPLVPRLALHYQLFVVDLPGYDTFDEIAGALFEIIPTGATWLGWSLGGMLAWWIAIHHPDRVKRLITVATSPKFICEQDWPGISEAILEKFARDLIYDSTQALQDFLILQLRGSSNNQELFSELKKQLFNANPHSISTLLSGLRLLRETDLRAELDKVIAPSLHIFGSHDTLVPASIVPILQPLLLHGQCEIIKRAGHIPFLAQMEEFLALIL